MSQEWLGTKAAADHINASVSFMHQNRKGANGKKVIPYTRIGRKIFYCREDLDDFLNKNKVTKVGE